MKKQNIAGMLVLLSVTLCLILCGIGYCYDKVFPDADKVVLYDHVSIDWESIYPFKSTNVDDDVNSENTEDDLKPFHVRLADTLALKFQGLQDHMFGASKLEKTSGYITVGWAEGMKYLSDYGNYARTEDGYLVDKDNEVPQEQLDSGAEMIESLQEFCMQQGALFAYVKSPTKIEESDLKTIKDYRLQNNAIYDEALKERGVDILDLNEWIDTEVENHHSAFYITDHHWKAVMGLPAAKKITETLNNKFNLDLDTECYDPDKYEIRTYKNAMFGSLGNALGHAYADSEDMEFLIPTSETNLHVEHPDINYDETGSWEDVMISSKVLDMAISSEGGYAYESLLGGNRPLTKITNLNSDNGKKILVIKDSFALAVLPYLATCEGISEIDALDVRPGQGNFTGSVHAYIEKMQPDIVLIMLSDYQTGALSFQ